MLKRTLLTTVAILSATVAQAAFAGDNNEFTIDQEGNYAAAGVAQNGDNNVAHVRQKTYDHNRIEGTPAVYGTVNQKGYKNTANLQQTGYETVVGNIVQEGANNTSDIIQTGVRIAASSTQYGLNNKSLITTLNSGGQPQTNFDHVLTTAQSGQNNEATITAGTMSASSAGILQDGERNKANVHVSTYGAFSRTVGPRGIIAPGVYQVGTENEVNQGLYGHYSNASSSQVGFANKADVYVWGEGKYNDNLRGPGNYVKTDQSGNYNVAKVSVAGNGNLDTLIQKGERNKSTVSIAGTDTIGNHTQTGKDNVQTVLVEGNLNSVTSLQDGTLNISDQIQGGSTNTSEVKQYGNRSVAYNEQFGTRNNGSITQTSNQTRPSTHNASLAASIWQRGTENTARVTQNNGSDTVFTRAGITQEGDRNTASVSQDNTSGAMNVLTQLGSDNTFAVTNDGVQAAAGGYQYGRYNSANIYISGQSDNLPHHTGLMQDGTSNSFLARVVGNDVHIAGPATSRDGVAPTLALQQGSNNNANLTVTGNGSRIDNFLQVGDSNRAIVNLHNDGPNTGTINNGYESIAWIDQQGSANNLDIDSVGTHNLIRSTQRDGNQSAEVDVRGSNNRVTTNQSGLSNTADVNIVGDNNVAEIAQAGTGNQATQTINGSGNNFYISQTGAYNVATEYAQGNANTFSIVQNGNNNNGNLSVNGDNNRFSIEQTGNNLAYDITRTGNDGNIRVVQTEAGAVVGTH